MRKNVKENLIDIIPTILDAHEIALKYAKSGEIDLVMSVFTECQEAMVKIGEVIEENEGENHKTIEFLQGYCDELYEVSLVIAENNEPNFNKLFKRIALKLKDVLYSIKNDIKVKQEIVFMPYKASMWDALESVWKAADEDPDCDAYVVPIPYYDRKNDFSFGEMHYEGEDFPDYVPITHYNAYNLETRHPDAIYIHNPYDECNYVTSVDPRFYSSELKKYTDCLVYIPYFVVSDGVPEHHCTTPACCYADKVFLQSETIRDTYIEVFTKAYGNSFGDPKEKFIASGSPKFDKVANSKKEDFELPENWKNLIGEKKVILYNTSVGSILKGDSAYIEKLKDVLNYFKTQNDVILWWRPHPLSATTYDSMRPALLDEYLNLVEEYKSAGYGIYDDTPDLHRALAWSDAYYGDRSSLVALYQLTGKPVMIQSLGVKTTDDFLDLTFEAMYDDGEYLWFTPIYFNALMKMNKVTEEIELVGFFPGEQAFGIRLFSDIAKCGDKLYFVPHSANAIAVYDIEKDEFDKICFDENYIENPHYKFYSVAVDGSNLFFIPHSYSAVLIYDTISEQVSYITGWATPIKNTKLYNDSYGYFRKYEMVDRKLYLPCLCTNAVAILDMDSKNFQLLELGDKNFVFQSICGVGKALWLAPGDGNEVCKINLDSGVIETVEVTGVQPISRKYTFRDVVAIDEKAIFFPFVTQKIVLIDSNTNEFNIVDEYGVPVQKQLFDGHFINTKKIADIIYAVNVQNGSLCVYNKELKMVKSISLEIPIELKRVVYDRNSKVLEEVDESLITADACNIAEGGFALTDLIGYFCSDYIFARYDASINKRADIRKKTLANSNGMAGFNIYQIIKRWMKKQ